MTHWLIIAGLLQLFAVWLAMSIGYYRGYKHGFNAAESNHDFDTCKHCGEAPWFDEELDEDDETDPFKG